MLENLRSAFVLGPAFLRIVTAEYADVDDFFAAADRLERGRNEFGKLIETNPTFQELANRPPLRLDLDLDRLLELPQDTVGHIYATQMRAQGFDVIHRHEPTDTTAKVRSRLEQAHDLWHVVTGFGTDHVGEIGLQAFYLAQLDLRLANLAIAAVMLRSMREDRDRVENLMSAIAHGWSAGSEAEQLALVEWPDVMHMRLDELRQQLNVRPATGVLSTGRYQDEVPR